MYPTRYIDSGKVLAVDEAILNSLLMKEIALAGREEPRLLLMTTIMPIITIETFLFYLKGSSSALNRREDNTIHTVDQL